MFLSLFVCTQGCYCEGLADIVLLRTYFSKAAGHYQHYMVCSVLPFSKGLQKQRRKKPSLCGLWDPTVSFCHFLGVQKHIEQCVMLLHGDVDMYCPLTAGLCSFSSPGRSEMAF